MGDSMTRTVTSADGTTIAFDELGSGPPLILAAGAFNTRATTAPLAAALRESFKTINYDRRGRGDSGDVTPYAVEREIEDLDALIASAGGSAAVFGYSSGANLVLQAAARGLGITHLALYEPPFIVDGSRPLLPADTPRRLAELVAADRRGEAVELYQAEVIGMPGEVVARLRQAPFRPGLEAIAHTLAYDAEIIGDLALPADLLAAIKAPALVIDGEQSPPLMRNAAQAVADGLPDGRRLTLSGEGHDISPDVTAAALVDFLTS
jgi:pimeloyl-ACP methyl ester carboxylesterase